MSAADSEASEMTEAISAAMVDLYGSFYGHDRPTATTYFLEAAPVPVGN